MKHLKELIRLYSLTTDDQVRAWLRDTFESAKLGIMVTCPYNELQEVRALQLN